MPRLPCQAGEQGVKGCGGHVGSRYTPETQRARSQEQRAWSKYLGAWRKKKVPAAWRATLRRGRFFLHGKPRQMLADARDRVPPGTAWQARLPQSNPQLNALWRDSVVRRRPPAKKASKRTRSGSADRCGRPIAQGRGERKSRSLRGLPPQPHYRPATRGPVR